MKFMVEDKWKITCWLRGGNLREVSVGGGGFPVEDGPPTSYDKWSYGPLLIIDDGTQFVGPELKYHSFFDTQNIFPGKYHPLDFTGYIMNKSLLGIKT